MSTAWTLSDLQRLREDMEMRRQACEAKEVVAIPAPPPLWKRMFGGISTTLRGMNRARSSRRPT